MFFLHILILYHLLEEVIFTLYYLYTTTKVLTSQLRQMEQSGLVNRKVYAEVPPRVEYSLTELGFSLHPIMDAMWDWGEAYKKKLAQEEDAAANV